MTAARTRQPNSACTGNLHPPNATPNGDADAALGARMGISAERAEECIPSMSWLENDPAP